MNTCMFLRTIPNNLSIYYEDFVLRQREPWWHGLKLNYHNLMQPCLHICKRIQNHKKKLCLWTNLALGWANGNFKPVPASIGMCVRCTGCVQAYPNSLKIASIWYFMWHVLSLNFLSRDHLLILKMWSFSFFSLLGE